MTKTFMEEAIMQSISKADLNGAVNIKALIGRAIKGITDQTEVQFVNALTWFIDGSQRIDLNKYSITFASGTGFVFYAALVTFRENTRPDRLLIYVSPGGIMLTEAKAEN